MQTQRAILSLGSNLGDRAAFLRAGIEALSKICGRIIQQSRIYESEVWGATEQNDYFNIAVVLETALSSEELLQACQKIEAAQGRIRETKWGARTLDIDILFYDDAIISLPHLIIPHPLMAERRFVLEPLAEIAANRMHPQNGKTVAEMLHICKDKGWVRPM